MSHRRNSSRINLSRTVPASFASRPRTHARTHLTHAAPRFRASSTQPVAAPVLPRKTTSPIGTALPTSQKEVSQAVPASSAMTQLLIATTARTVAASKNHVFWIIRRVLLGKLQACLLPTGSVLLTYLRNPSLMVPANSATMTLIHAMQALIAAKVAEPSALLTRRCAQPVKRLRQAIRSFAKTICLQKAYRMLSGPCVTSTSRPAKKDRMLAIPPQLTIARRTS